MKYSRKINFLFLMIIFSLVLMVQAKEQEEKEKEEKITEERLKNEYIIRNYWSKLEEKARDMYNRIDLTVSVQTGLEQRDYFNGGDEFGYGYGGIRVEVPLYSAKDRRTKFSEKSEYLIRGAEIIKKLEENTRKLDIKRDAATTLKVVMMEEGTQGIREYYKTIEEIITLEVEIEEAKRKLDAMIK